MSGICGVWNLDGRPVEKALLARLSARLAHRGSDAEGLWIEGAIGLACHLHRVTPQSSTETQPLLDSSGAVVVFDGRLDNREEVLASVDPTLRIIPDAPDPTLVLATYRTFGDRFPERLNGDFSLGLFDPGRQQLLLARDAIGIRPLYYARTPHSFLFASEIKALLAHPQLTPRPNDDHLAEYLLGGATCDGDAFTFVDGVSNLGPGHMAVVTPRGFRAHRYWDFDPSRQTRLGSFAEYAEAFRQLLEEAVRRRLRSAYPVAVSVSGGLDSSSVFCLAETLVRRDPSLRSPILGASYVSADGSPSDEAAFLPEIERDYGVTIERVPMRLGLLDGAREAVWHAEMPLMDEQWNTTHGFLSTVHRRGARVILTGHWADQVLFDQAYLIDLFRRFAWREIRDHLWEYGQWHTDADPRYFRRRFLRDLAKEYVPSALVSRLRRLSARRLPWYADWLQRRAHRLGTGPTTVGDAFATAHARSLYEEARSRYHVLCMEWENKVAAMHGLDLAFPFLDRDLLAFLISIPGEMQTWRGVPKAILREAMRAVLPTAIRERRWKADFTDRVNQGMTQDFPQLVRYLQSDGMAIKLGYLRADVMRSEFERLGGQVRGPTSELSWGLSDLLGLELWLRLFLGENAGAFEEPEYPRSEWART